MIVLVVAGFIRWHQWCRRIDVRIRHPVTLPTTARASEFQRRVVIVLGRHLARAVQMLHRRVRVVGCLRGVMFVCASLAAPHDDGSDDDDDEYERTHDGHYEQRDLFETCELENVR